MRSENTRVEVIAHFSKEQKEPKPLRVRLSDQGELVVIKVAFVRNVKYLTSECIQYECCFLRDGQQKMFFLTYWIKDMEWHISSNTPY